jgi:hypothetical protein
MQLVARGRQTQQVIHTPPVSRAKIIPSRRELGVRLLFKAPSLRLECAGRMVDH